MQHFVSLELLIGAWCYRHLAPGGANRNHQWQIRALLFAALCEAFAAFAVKITARPQARKVKTQSYAKEILV